MRLIDADRLEKLYIDMLKIARLKDDSDKDFIGFAEAALYNVQRAPTVYDDHWIPVERELPPVKNSCSAFVRLTMRNHLFF